MCLIFNLSNANLIAFAPPPLPKIRAVFLSPNKGLMLFEKPIQSVLWPIVLPSINWIVFTAPIFFASSVKSSKKGIILSLYGIVTLSPESLLSAINLGKSAILFNSKFLYFYSGIPSLKNFLEKSQKEEKA